MRLRHWLRRLWEQERRRDRQRELCASRALFSTALVARQLEERRVLSVAIDANTQTTATGDEGQEITIQVDFTDDSGTHVATIDWGDGTVENVNPADLTEPPGGGAPGSVFGKHTYADDGNYTITVTITDSIDGNDSAQAIIDATISNVAPVVVLNNPATADEGTQVTFTPTVTDQGADDQTAGFTYSWTVTRLSDNSVVASDMTDTVMFTPPDDGDYEVSFTATDVNGDDTTETATITINNVAPVVVLNNPANGNEGELVTFTPTVTDQGPDDQTAGFTYNWTVTRLSDNSVVASDTTDTVSFTPPDDGDYEVSFTASDQNGADTTETATITINNVAPVVVLNNPANGNEGALITFTPTVTDQGPEDQADGFTYSWTVTRLSDNSVVASGTTDTVSFTPPDDGDYEVSFTASDQNGADTTETATITINNVAPVVVLNNPANGNEGALITFTPTVTDQGPEDQAEGFTYSWTVTRLSDNSVLASGSSDTVTFTPPDDGNYEVSFTATDQNGAATTETAIITINNVVPTVVLNNPATADEGAVVTFTPTVTDQGPEDQTAGFTYSWTVTRLSDNSVVASGTSDTVTFTPPDDGNYEVSFTATDQNGAPTTETAIIAINNVAPVVVLNNPATANEGGLVTFTPTVTDQGPEDQAAGFTYSWTVTRLSDNTVVASGNTDTVSFTPADNGDFEVSFTATDQDSVGTTGTATITINNVAPAVAAPTIDNVTIDEGGTVNINGTFSDPSLVDTHTVIIHWGDGHSTTLSSLDPGFTQNAGGGSYTASHTYLDDPSGAPTQYTITIEVVDDDSGTGTNSATQVTVNNLPPAFGAVTNTGVSPEGNVSVSGTFTDPGVLDTHTVWVNWGDGTSSQAIVSGNTFTADHTYLGSPNVNNPTADIPISITLIDDDGGSVTIVSPAAVPATGIATPTLVVTTDIPTLDFPTVEISEQAAANDLVTEASQGSEVQPSAASPAAANEARLVLRVIAPNGEDGDEFELELEVLNQLPGWYKRLPDNHYRIVLIREDGTQVRVSDVVVRQGKPVDPNDAFQGESRGRSDADDIELPPLPAEAEQPTSIPSVGEAGAAAIQPQPDELMETEKPEPAPIAEATDGRSAAAIGGAVFAWSVRGDATETRRRSGNSEARKPARPAPRSR